MATTELVSDDGVAAVAQRNGDAGDARLSVRVGSQHSHRLDAGLFRVLMVDHLDLPRRLVEEAVQRLAGFDPLADDGEPVLVQLVHELRSWVVGTDVAEPQLGLDAALVLHQVDELRLVHAAVAESPLVARFVQNHGVFHVVARVGDHRHHRIHALRVLVHLCVEANQKARKMCVRNERRDEKSACVSRVGITKYSR